METKGIKNLELAFDAIEGIVKAGEKTMKDGKIDLADIQHLPELFNAVSDLVKAAKEYKELVAEAKDIKGDEAVKLVSKLFF